MRLPKPVIAKVQGSAYGGGGRFDVYMRFSYDCGENAKFGLTETRLRSDSSDDKHLIL